MINNFLKVYDEDLINGAINKASVTSDKVLTAGGTMGALCVNVFAQTDMSVATEMTVTLKHADAENGAYAELLTLKVPAKSYKAGELAATATLPHDAKAYLMASAASATGNSGNVRVTLGYLAR